MHFILFIIKTLKLFYYMIFYDIIKFVINIEEL